MPTMQIKSKSSDREYSVLLRDDGVYKCTCPDFKFRHDGVGTHCKHIIQATAKGLTIKVSRSRKTKISRAVADKMVAKLRPVFAKTTKYAICGSYRRGKKIMSDLDLITVATDEEWSALCAALAAKGEQIYAGDKKVAFVISGIQVDVNRVYSRDWGSALLHFTGSMAENVRLRQIAKSFDLVLSQNGIRERGSFERVNHYKTEKAIYRFLGVPYVEPSAR